MAGGAVGWATVAVAVVLPAVVAATTHTIELEFDGYARKALLHVPEREGNRPLPLVFNWHGFANNMGQQQTYSDMSPLADREGFMVIYPDGYQTSHNGGACCAPANSLDLDDVGLAKRLIDKVDEISAVDRARVFSTGMSNGGFMLIRLGCEAADVFTAVGSVTGVLGNLPASPSKFECGGTADTAVPYDGEPKRGFASVAHTVATYLERNGCRDDPVETYRVGAVQCWSHCAGNQSANVTHCKVSGGKHSWWGSPLCSILWGGAGCNDIDATQQMWQFFKAARPLSQPPTKASDHTVSAADPHCEYGIRVNDVCCSKSCGAACAVHGCGKARGGAKECCGSAIRAENNSCAAYPAPCVLPSPTPPTPGPSPQPQDTCGLDTGVEYLGNNTVVRPAVPCSSVAKCCEECTNTSTCAFFTFNLASKTCTLRNENAPDTSRPNTDCTSGERPRPGPAPGPAPQPPSLVTVEIAAQTAVSKTGDAYVAWNIDASRNRGFFDRSLSPFSGFGKMLARQAAAISRETVRGKSILRFGGSGNDYLTYAFGGTQCPPQSDYKECLNTTWWTNLLDFARAAEAQIVFGLSMNTGHDLSTDSGPFPQPWDPTNAEQILKWTIANKYDDLLLGMELGNEQNSRYSGEQIATDFAILANLTAKLWPHPATRPKLIGPDPHSYHGQDPKVSWLGDFLRSARDRGLDIYAATHHEYAEVDATTFTSPSTLDVTATVAKMVNNTVRTAFPSAQVWAGEIGPHNGGSPPCDHSSMRWANFGDSLWYADALGSKAAHGYQAFCRQDFIGADYGLLDCSTGAPLPDFYTALLFARTLGPEVLQAIVITPKSDAIRAYAHCGRGALTSGPTVSILLINLGQGEGGSTNVSLVGLKFDQARPRTEYVLTPSAKPGITNATGLLGTGIELNGVPLIAGADGTIPQLDPVSVTNPASPIQLPSTSIAFVVVPVLSGSAPPCQ